MYPFFYFLDFGIFASAIGLDAQNSDAEARLRYKLPKSMRMEYADGVPRSDGEMTTPTSPNRDPTVVTTHTVKKKMNSFVMRRFFYDPTMIFYYFRFGVGCDEKIETDVLRGFELGFYGEFRRAADLGCRGQIEIHPTDFTEVDEDRVR